MCTWGCRWSQRHTGAGVTGGSMPLALYWVLGTQLPLNCWIIFLVPSRFWGRLSVVRLFLSNKRNQCLSICYHIIIQIRLSAFKPEFRAWKADAVSAITHMLTTLGGCPWCLFLWFRWFWFHCLKNNHCRGNCHCLLSFLPSFPLSFSISFPSPVPFFSFFSVSPSHSSLPTPQAQPGENKSIQPVFCC